MNDEYEPEFSTRDEFDAEVDFLMGRLDAYRHQESLAQRCVEAHSSADLRGRGRWRGHLVVRDACLEAQTHALMDFIRVVRGRLFPE